MLPDTITDADLSRFNCLEDVDRVPADPATTAFKRRARLQQARWRNDKCLPCGSQPMNPKPGDKPRPLGSRIEINHARNTSANFLTPAIRQAVCERLAHPQEHQMLNADRLYCDLLSSMPMCFNLFGELWADLKLADQAVHAWWPDTPGQVSAVRFEWSPGRCIHGQFLENRTAFDVAFELTLPGNQKGVIGVETKYHEHCRPEEYPKPDRCQRYEDVVTRSQLMPLDTLRNAVFGKDLQQICLDHLLAVSMKQPTDQWAFARFVLVHPKENPSFPNAANRYRDLLTDPSSFEVRTIESFLDANVLPEPTVSAFRARYLW